MKNKIKVLMLLAFTVSLFTACDDGDDPLSDTTACFSYLPEGNIRVGDTVYFSNCSENALSYAWDFGDDATSTDTEPFHIYETPGVFDITLKATNESVVKSVVGQISVSSDLSYIINYGSYSGDKTTISAFDRFIDEMTNGYYKAINSVDIISNVQYAYNYNNNIYFMGNNADEIFFVDEKTFEQTKNAITTDIVKPRYCVGSGDYLYVSCWGGDIWTDETLSYIAKVNITTNVVEKKIALAGGPEGLAIANNKLYAALGYKDSVAVMDLGTQAISYIETPAVSSYFLKDNNDNLYVSLVSTYSDFSTETGLGYITTSNDNFTAYQHAGVSSGYIDVMAANDDFSKIYVVTEGANWGDPGALAVFDVPSKSFEANKFLESVPGINGVGFQNDKVFCFVAASVTGNGQAVTYSEDGTKVSEYETGIAPFMLLKTE